MHASAGTEGTEQEGRERRGTESDGASGDNGSTSELFGRIAIHIRTIAHGELELVRGEVRQAARAAAAEGAMVLFGGVVALIGFAMLCVAAVVALAPLIASLALRLVLMAVVYGGIGSVIAATFGLRLRRNAVPHLKVPLHEIASTIKGVRAAIQGRG
jgi:hypothetical protein